MTNAQTFSFLEVLKAIEMGWSHDTSYNPEEWGQYQSRGYQAWGQCVPTAYVLRLLYGGEIERGRVRPYKHNRSYSHYWNIIDGERLDCTWSQYGWASFRGEPISQIKPVADPKKMFHQKGVRERCALLHARVELQLLEWQSERTREEVDHS